MKLYIKQKVFSWRDQFAVRDADGAERWFAQGELFSWGRKLHVCDTEGREAAFIHRKNWSFLPKYYIEIDGNTYLLASELSFLKRRLHLEGLPWRMEGNFSAHEYELFNGNETIMRMSKHWFTWGDSYELDIPRLENELLCLCVALAVDCMQADSAAAAAAAS
ncbi:MAG: hypothetical protein LBG83_09470 [Oscillospiraceae bacterium]|jgi:uncharacterized protein YxjI|nr:hypothetical protein [Oscillospiraceae bacterium]